MDYNRQERDSWLLREWPGVLVVAVAIATVTASAAYHSIIEESGSSQTEDTAKVDEQQPEDDASEPPDRKPNPIQRLREALTAGGPQAYFEELSEIMDDPAQRAFVMRVGFAGLCVLGLGVAGLASWVFLLVSWYRGRTLIPKASLLPSRCGLWDVFTIMAFVVGLLTGVKLISESSVSSLPPVGHSGMERLIMTALLGMATVLYVIYVVYRRHDSWLGPLGLASDDFQADFKRGAVAYFVIFPLIAAASIAVMAFMQHMDIKPETNRAIPIIQDTQGKAGVALMMLIVAVIVPFVEEVIFRGFLHPWLRRYTPAWVTILLVSVIFTGLHPIMNWPQIMILAVTMGYLRERTQSLVPCIVLHMALNGINFTLMRLMS